MPYSQKYTLVAPVNPLSVGDEFSMYDWPLHITLTDVFSIDRSGTDIDRKLAKLIKKHTPITTRATKDAMHGTFHVVLLRNDPPLMGLHNDILDLLAANGAVFNSPEYTRSGYLPHCTVQGQRRLHISDQVDIRSLALIDMFPGGDWKQRKVLRLFPITASN